MSVKRTITISLPAAMGLEVEQLAKAEHRTVSELIRETIRQYQALKHFRGMAKQGKRTAKRKKLTAKDFGGPFED
jgi:predicted transcriptional regulator